MIQAFGQLLAYPCLAPFRPISSLIRHKIRLIYQMLAQELGVVLIFSQDYSSVLQNLSKQWFTCLAQIDQIHWAT